MWSFLPLLQLQAAFLTLVFAICGGLTGSKNLIEDDPERAVAGADKPNPGGPAQAPERKPYPDGPAVGPDRKPYPDGPAVAPDRKPSPGGPAVAPDKKPDQDDPAVAPGSGRGHTELTSVVVNKEPPQPPPELVKELIKPTATDPPFKQDRLNPIVRQRRERIVVESADEYPPYKGPKIPDDFTWSGYSSSEDADLTNLVPVADCNITGDSGVEARLRHIELNQNNFLLRLSLQKEEITRSSYKNFFKSKGKILHTEMPEKEMDREERAELLNEMKKEYGNKRVTVSQRAPAYIVYGYDECRGEAEFDEETMDDKEWKGLKHFQEKLAAKRKEKRPSKGKKKTKKTKRGGKKKRVKSK